MSARRRWAGAWRWLRRLALGLGLLVFGPVLLVVLFLLFLLTPPGNSLLRVVLVDQVNGLLTEGSVALGDLRFNGISHLRLERLELRDGAGEAVVQLEVLDLRYWLPALLHETLSLESVLIQRPSVALRAGPDGQLNLIRMLGLPPSPPDEPPSPPFAGLPLAVRLGALDLVQGDLRYQDGDLDVSVADLNLRAAAEGEGGTIDLRGLWLTGALRAPVQGAVTLEGEAGWRDGDVLIPGLTFQFQESRLALEGRADAVETALALDLALDAARISAADVEALAGAPVLRQDVGLNLSVKGPLSALEASGQVTSEAGALALDLGADLGADPLSWRVALITAGLDLDALLVAVTERTHLAGTWRAEGKGTAWPAGIAATVSGSGVGQTVWGEPLPALRVEAALADGVLRLDRLVVGHGVGRVKGRGRVDLVAETAALDARVDLPDLGRLRRFGVEGLGGGASFVGSARVGWGGEALSAGAVGTLSGDALAAPGGLRLEHLEAPLDLRYEADRLSGQGGLAFTGLEAAGARVGSGELSFSLEPGDAVIGVVDARLRAEAIVLPSADLKLASLEGTARAAPLIDAPWGDVQLALAGLSLPVGRTVSGPLRLNLGGDALSGSVDLSDAQGPLLRGAAQGDLETGRWQIDGLTLAPTAAVVWESAAPARFTLKNGGAVDVAAALESSAGRLVAAGDLDRSTRSLKLGIEDLDLGYVAHVTELLGLVEAAPAARGAPAFDGRASLSVDLGQDSAGPYATVNLKLRDLASAPVARELDLDLDLAAREAGTRLTGALLHRGKAWLSVGGDLPLDLPWSPDEPQVFGLDCDRPVALRMIAGPLSAADLATALPGLSSPVDALSADVTLSGASCDPALDVVAAAEKTVGASGEKVRTDLKLARVDEAVRLDVGVEQGLLRWVEVSGEGQTKLKDVFAWALRGGEKPALEAPETWLSNFSLSVVPMAVPLEAVAAIIGVPGVLSGRLGGGVAVDGDTRRPSVSAGLVWVGGRLGQVELSNGYVGLLPSQDASGLSGYDLSVILGFVEGGSLEVAGFLPFDVNFGRDLGVELRRALEQPGLALTVSGEGVPIAALVGPAQGVYEPSGRLKVAGTVSGSLLAPDPDLEVTVQGGGATLGATAVRYEDVNLSLHFDQRALRIDALSLNTRPRFSPVARQGKLTLSGAVDLEGYAPTRVKLSARMDDFHASATTDYVIALTGGLGLTGDWPALSVEGTVVLADGKVNLNQDFFLSDSSLDLDPTLSVHRPSLEQERRKKDDTPAVWERFPLDLKVDLKRSLSLKVDMPLSGDFGKQLAELSSVKVDATFDGVLDVGGTLGDLKLLGGLETVRGGVEVMGASFALEPEGQVNFAGGSIADPNLNLDAVRHTGQYGDVTAHIGGTASSPEPTFHSEEYTDQSDVLSLLLFGKPASELTDGEGEAGAMVFSMALSSLTGQVEKAIGLTGLDQFEIDPSSGAVRVGKALSDRLFLTLELRPNPEDNENTTQATVEWFILRRLYAEFITGDRANSSADLYWRRRF